MKNKTRIFAVIILIAFIIAPLPSVYAYVIGGSGVSSSGGAGSADAGAKLAYGFRIGLVKLPVATDITPVTGNPERRSLLTDYAKENYVSNDNYTFYYQGFDGGSGDLTEERVVPKLGDTAPVKPSKTSGLKSGLSSSGSDYAFLTKGNFTNSLPSKEEGINPYYKFIYKDNKVNIELDTLKDIKALAEKVSQEDAIASVRKLLSSGTRVSDALLYWTHTYNDDNVVGEYYYGTLTAMVTLYRASGYNSKYGDLITSFLKEADDDDAAKYPVVICVENVVALYNGSYTMWTTVPQAMSSMLDGSVEDFTKYSTKIKSKADGDIWKMITNIAKSGKTNRGDKSYSKDTWWKIITKRMYSKYFNSDDASWSAYTGTYKGQYAMTTRAVDDMYGFTIAGSALQEKTPTPPEGTFVWKLDPQDAIDATNKLDKNGKLAKQTSTIKSVDLTQTKANITKWDKFIDYQSKAGAKFQIEFIIYRYDNKAASKSTAYTKVISASNGIKAPTNTTHVTSGTKISTYIVGSKNTITADNLKKLLNGTTKNLSYSEKISGAIDKTTPISVSYAMAVNIYCDKYENNKALPLKNVDVNNVKYTVETPVTPPVTPTVTPTPTPEVYEYQSQIVSPYSELKAGYLTDAGADEPYEAMAGFPTTQNLFYASGGKEFVVQLKYEFEEGQNSSRTYTQPSSSAQTSLYIAPETRQGNQDNAVPGTKPEKLKAVCGYCGEIKETDWYSVTTAETAWNWKATATAPSEEIVPAVPASGTPGQPGYSAGSPAVYCPAVTVTTTTSNSASPGADAVATNAKGTTVTVAQTKNGATKWNWDWKNDGYSNTISHTITWTQSIEDFNYAKIVDAKVWQLTQAKLDGTYELSTTDDVTATVQATQDSVLYNVASANTAAAGRLWHSQQSSGQDKYTFSTFNPSGHSEACVAYAAGEALKGKSPESIYNNTYAISDYLILRTSAGDLSMLYFEYDAKNTTVPVAKVTLTGAKKGGSYSIQSDPVTFTSQNSNATEAKVAKGNSTFKGINLKPDGITFGGYSGNYSSPSTKYVSSKGFTENVNVSSIKINDSTYSKYKATSKPSPVFKLVNTFDVPDQETSNGEYEVGDSYVFYKNIINFGSIMDPIADIETVDRFSDTGFELLATYSPNHSKINDVVVHNPTSSQYATFLPLDKTLDQRTSDQLKSEPESTSANKKVYYTLNCKWLKGSDIIELASEPDLGLFATSSTYNSGLSIQTISTGEKALYFPTNTYAKAFGIAGILHKNKTYTVEFDAWTTSSSDVIRVDAHPDTLPEKSVNITNERKRYSVQISSSLAEMEGSMLRIFVSAETATGNIYVTDIKVFEGNSLYYTDADYIEQEQTYTIPNPSVSVLHTYQNFTGTDLQGFTPTQVTATTESGDMKLTNIQADGILSNTDVNIEASAVYKINVKLKFVNNASTSVQLFWDNGSGYNEEQSLHVTTDGSSNYQTVSFKVADDPGWNGIIKGIRIDPNGSNTPGGTIYISAISVYGIGNVSTATGAQDTIDFAYTGGIQSFVAPVTTDYTFKVWGAQGGNDGGISSQYATDCYGGYGGYAQGTVTITAGTTMYVVVGGKGGDWSNPLPGFNGGGAGGTSAMWRYGGAGGGATHISTRNGILAGLSSYRDSIYVVAGGGGGADGNASAGGSGGGLSGTSPYSGILPGTQTSGYLFGQGESGGTNAGGGGGGFFGGKAGNSNYGAAGGSGYINPYLLNQSFSTGVNTGNGKASISYAVKGGLKITAKSGESVYSEQIVIKHVLNSSEVHQSASTFWQRYTEGWKFTDDTYCIGVGDTHYSSNTAFKAPESDYWFTPNELKSNGYLVKYKGAYYLTIGTDNFIEQLGKEVILDTYDLGFGEQKCIWKLTDVDAPAYDATVATSATYHYSYGDPMDWDEHIIEETPTSNPVTVGGVSYPTSGDFLILDRSFQIYFPNYGDFYGNGAYGIGTTSPTTGKGYTTPMNTTAWLKAKYVTFGFDVIYDKDGDGDFSDDELFISGEPVPLGEFNYKGANSTTNFDDYSGGSYIYNFYIPLENSEAYSSSINYYTVALNANEDYYTSNPSYINMSRDTYTKEAYHDSTKSIKVDLIGRIGGLTMVDTGDFRFANLFKQTTSGWLIDNIVKKVNPTKQNYYMADKYNIRGELATSATNGLNTYNTQTYKQDISKLINFPLTPNSNNIQSLTKQPQRVGYLNYLSLETIGNYYSENLTDDSVFKVQITPYYYHLDLQTGKWTPVDVYALTPNSGYQRVNQFNNANASAEYEWFYNLNWTEELDRRNYTTAEKKATDSVVNFYRNYITVNDEPVANSVLIPAGREYIFGTIQRLFLKDRNRTFIGSSLTNGVFTNPGEKVEEERFARQGQRYHFTLGLPSSSVFVESGKTYTQANVDSLANDHSVIVCAIETFAKGQVWTLKYSGVPTAEQVIKILPTGSTYNYSNNPNGPGDKIIVTVYSPNKSSKDDLNTEGTH